MTFTEVKALVLSQVEKQYVSFTWENDNYRDGRSATECRIYVESANASYRGQTWASAYDRFAKAFCVPGVAMRSPCPTDEVAG